MSFIRFTRFAPGALALGLALGACSDAPLAPTAATTAPRASAITPSPIVTEDRLATIESEGRLPALYIQTADGKTRTRVHFRGVYDRIAGNYPQTYLPTTDEAVLALGPAKWSPDGRQLAVIVTLGFDQSQVVVMNADGHNIRVASPNGQIILGDVDWAPDGNAIAYTMSTMPGASAVDLFVTDLTRDVVHRVTTGGRFGIFDEYRFDAKGQGLWLTQFEGWSDDQLNRVSRVYHATLDGTMTGTGAKVVGNPQGIARDGSWVLATRVPRDGDGWTSELVREPLVDGGEEVLLGSGVLQYAELIEGDEEAMLATLDPRSWTTSYTLLGVAAPKDDRGSLSVSQNLVSLAFYRARR